MTVYVDKMRRTHKKMILCNMKADSLEELHSMAVKIGVSRHSFQGDHYYLCLNKRKEAISAGAKEI